jgi:hypothetical protein
MQDHLENAVNRLAARLPGGERPASQAPKTPDADGQGVARPEDFGADDAEFRKSA